MTLTLRITLSVFTSLLFGGTASFLSLTVAALFFLEPAAILGLQALGFTPLLVGLLLRQTLGLFGLQALLLCQIDLTTRLTFKHITLNVGALDTHLYVDRASTTLSAGHLQLALRLALERDFARRRRGLVAAVTATQVRQQFQLGLIVDHITRAAGGDASLLELDQQSFNRDLQDLGKLCNSDISHIFPPSRPTCRPRTRFRALS